MADNQPNLDTFFADFHQELFRRASVLTDKADPQDFFLRLSDLTEMIIASSLFIFIPRLKRLAVATKKTTDKQNLLLALNRILEITQKSSGLGYEIKGSDHDILNALNFSEPEKDILIIHSDKENFALSASDVIRIIEPGQQALSGIKTISLSANCEAYFAVIVRSKEKTFAFLTDSRPYLEVAALNISDSQKFAVLKNKESILFLDLNTLV